jgi:hypothetical protein
LSLSLGLFDVFTYIVPGSLYLSVLLFLADSRHLIHFQSFMGVPSIVLIAGLLIASYLLGWASEPVLLAGLFAYASRQGLLIEALARPDSEEVAAVRRKFTPTIVAYAATVALGLLIPAAAVAVYFGIAIFVVTPFRQITPLLRRQRNPGH